MDGVKLAEAIAWPIATIVVAVVILLIVKMIISKRGKIGFSIKDWLKFEADGSKQIAESVAQAPVHAEAGLVIPPPTGEAGSDAKPSMAALAEAPLEPPIDHGDISIGQMIDASNVTELDIAWASFQAADPETDKDFWTTYYIERKRELGGSGASEDLMSLAEANVTWVSPLLSMLRTAVGTHDIETAEVLIRQSLARKTKDNAALVLHSVVNAYYRMISPIKALSFYQETVAAGATSGERSAMLFALAASLESSTQTFAYHIATEMALIGDPGRASDRFSLALDYADNSRNWTMSFIRYCEIDSKSDQHIWSLNNRGVLIRDIDKEVSMDYYSRAASAGNALATSNLAAQLISDGYYAVAERLLDEIKDPGEAVEHITSTRAAALAGRRKMSTRLDEIHAFAQDETRRYDAVVAKSLRSIDRSDPHPKGVFGSNDRTFMVMFDAAGAAFRVTVGSLVFDGVLPVSILAYSGNLTATSQGLLASTMSVSLFITGKEEVTALIWPNTKSMNDRLRIYELRRLEPLPKLSLKERSATQQLTG
ncbi:hypothetical protein [Sphingomonas sp. FUKUSWIS1]|uniref:hypothetical protein n=1 Tax=Sphingomonas sp. FUKUSWIS1 TaxID=1379701 RepID=UPI0004DFA138|nr:hypothetical protein [Sphingomonas sp. FUKUSWIS1]